MTTENRKKMKDDFKQFIGSATKVAEELGTEIARSAEKIVEDARSMKRQMVISVRLDDDSIHRVDQLVTAGVFRTRSEAVAFLTREGIKSRKDVFDKIDEKIGEIERIQTELKETVLRDIPSGGEPPKAEGKPEEADRS